jgi:ABC-type transport system involved in multi-copper enzyme maturation permease subunit
MVAPLFYLELLHGSRRGQQHLFRWIYGGWLLAQFGIFCILYLVDYWEAGTAYASGRLIAPFVLLLGLQQFLLVLLGMPALAAAAITEEKTRGTLQELLTTDLTSAEIVLGKLLGQVARVVDLSMPGWLLLCFLGALGGLDPQTFLTVAAGVLAPLPALATAGLLASVWCRKTSNAVLLAYGITAAGLALVWGLGRLDPAVDPFTFAELLAGQPRAGPTMRGLLVLGLAWISLAVPCLAMAIWQLRPAFLRQVAAAGQAKPGRWRWVQRPPVTDKPLWWKEQHVEPLLDVFGLGRLPRWAVAWAVFLITLINSAGILALVRAGSAAMAFALQGLAVMLLAGLVVGVRTSASVCGERERGTWEALLLTPLTAKQLIRGKLWGTINASRPYLLAYTVPALGLSLFGGLRAVGWVLLGWVLTWVMMLFMGAWGLTCSLRSDSSWKSLTWTLASGYRDMLLRLAFVALPVCALCGGAVSALSMGFRAYPGIVAWLIYGFLWGAFLMAGALVFARAEQVLIGAEKYLGETQRVAQKEAAPPGRPGGKKG